MEIAIPNTMLGKQAEALFEKAIHTSKTYKIKAANIQVQGASETIGELDYIIMDTQNNQHIHVELACKFYLFDEKIEGPSAAKWIGPNQKDTLKDKLSKLKQKQFPLLHKEETTKILKKLDINASDMQQLLCLQAQLFIPKHTQKSDFQSNFQDCLVGHWLRFDEFLSEDKKASYSIPIKREWLVPMDEMTDWKCFEDSKIIISELIDNKRSPLVYKKNGALIERFFVVWW